MRRSNKYSVRRDTVHIDACSSLDVVHMNVAVFSYEIDDVILRRHLHRDREIVLRLRWEEHVHRFLWERLIAGGCLANL